MKIPFAVRTYDRPSYGLPADRLVNFFAEKGVVEKRLGRPGLVSGYSVGAGPVRGIYQQDGVFTGDTFTVSGTQVYRSTTLIGSVIGDGIARFAASASQLVIVSGGKAYVYDGSSLAAITDPDLPEVSDVANIAGRFVFTTLGSDLFYWSAINDATDIDGLAFATAEGSPDKVVAVAVLGDELFFFGSNSTEPWFSTGDADAPYQRTQGRRYLRGCAAQASIVPMDNTLIFVGDDGVVYRCESVPRRISEHGIEEALRRCTAVSEATAFYVGYDGHPFYVLNVPNVATFVYDVSTGMWAEWQSYGRQNFRCQCAVTVAGAVYLGDAVNGTVWNLSSDAYMDGSDPITGLLTAWRPAESGVDHNFNLMLQCVRGVGNADSTNPVVEMRYSDDGGRTYGDYRAASLGAVGEYSKKAKWRRLGSVVSPGRMYEIRITDPVLRAVEHLTADVQRP